MSALRPRTGSAELDHAGASHDRGVRAIVAYKSVKATAQLGSVAVLVGLWPFGLADHVEHAARLLHDHTTQMWARHFSGFLLSHATPRALSLLILGLGVDGAFTAFEAFALRRGYVWAPWLVVVATSVLLPFELFELLENPRPLRLVILLANAAIAAYLARSALRERRASSRG